jgi:hypothetical protein
MNTNHLKKEKAKFSEMLFVLNTPCLRKFTVHSISAVEVQLTSEKAQNKWTLYKMFSVSLKNL